MRGFNFTESVLKMQRLARDEARRLHHPHVAPQHLLLGLLRYGQGVANAVLFNRGIDQEALRARLEERLAGWPRAEVRRGTELPHSGAATQVFEMARSEAVELGHAYVGTEHCLIALFRQPDIAELAPEIAPDDLRAETLRILEAPL